MEKENPWRSIWCHPRSTIRSIIERNPNQSLWLLAFILGFSSLLNTFQTFPIALRTGLPMMFVLTLLLAVVWGYVVFSVWSWVILVTGKLFKGKGSFSTIRAAYAWSCVPLLGNLVLWVILVALFSSIIFFGPQPQLMITRPMMILLFFLLLGKVVFSIWSLVIYLQALAEVQSFSVLRAIGNLILGAIFLSLLIVIPLFLLNMVSGGFQTAAAFGSSLQDAIAFIQLTQ